MSDLRVQQHPVLPPPDDGPGVEFTWNGTPLQARPGEVISSALFAAGIHVFGHHHRDGAPQGIFCANGQCAQCTVVADGAAVKSCMTPVRPGMVVTSCEGHPVLPAAPPQAPGVHLPVEHVPVLVVGAGPAGLSAAVELGRRGVRVLVVDDKDLPGGKLVLQTHKFFGSIEDTRAGTRGTRIAEELAEELAAWPTVTLWREATAVAVFSDRQVGIVRAGRYHLVAPEVLVVATGAREKQVPFPGHTLPGVYGAGAFQTLLNRDRVRPCRRLFVLGGGNVGLIAAYHAIQADIEVAGLVEALPEVGGYKVHADKIRRLGVPIFLSHTVVEARGREHLEAVTIAAVGPGFKPVPGTERTFEVDTLLVAVGLSPLDEFARQAREAGLPVVSAGDAEEIAEASAATFGGRIAAVEVARALGLPAEDVPAEWRRKLEVLKARPGPARLRPDPDPSARVYPVIRCVQEIPCNPCATVCPRQAIRMEGDEILGLPRFEGTCTGCGLCVAICPGLAITLVDGRKDPEHPRVTLAFEQARAHVEPGSEVLLTDGDGLPLGRFAVEAVKVAPRKDRTLLVQVRVPRDLAPRVAGIQVQVTAPGVAAGLEAPAPSDATIICRCEHVTAGEIRAAIRAGLRDVNELKAALRVCMGACCGKNCPELIQRLFKEEGVDPGRVTPATLRPLFVEVPLGVFAGSVEDEG